MTKDNKIQKDDFIHTLEKGSIVSQMVSTKHSLADIAPTILEILGITKPVKMKGKSLWPILREKVKIK